MREEWWENNRIVAEYVAHYTLYLITHDTTENNAIWKFKNYDSILLACVAKVI